jgi:hypothetical protein
MLRDIFKGNSNLQTLEEVLTDIDCNFDAEQVPIFQCAPELGDTNPYKEIPGKSCIRRGDTKIPLGVMSARYGLSQFRETLGFLNDVVGSSAAEFYGARSIDNGASIFVAVKAPNTVMFAPDDAIECFYTASTSHDGTGSIQLMLTPVHKKTQTILAMLDSGIIRMRHTKLVKDRLARATGTINKMQAVWTQHEDKFRTFAKLTMNDDEARTYFAMVADSDKIGDEVPTRTLNVREKLFDIYKVGMAAQIPSCRGTLLGGFVSALVFGDYYKTTRTSIIGRSEQDVMIESRLSGTAARFKADAFAACLKLYRI